MYLNAIHIHLIDNTYQFGGSPLGNSRVKLTNIDDCVKKGYIKKGQNPLEIAANQLKKDSKDVNKKTYSLGQTGLNFTDNLVTVAC